MTTPHSPTNPEHDRAPLSSDELATISGGWCGTPWPGRFPFPKPPIPPIVDGRLGRIQVLGF